MKAPDAPYDPPALRAYARARGDTATGLRLLRGLAACATLTFAFFMLVVYAADGSAGNLGGVAERGLFLHLVLAVLPFGYLVAGPRAGSDDASFTLASLHGVDRRAFDAALAREALQAAAVRGAAAGGLLAAEMVVLSLSAPALVPKRFTLALALTGVGALFGALLALLGLASARVAGRRFGRLTFFFFVLLPVLLDWVVPGYPDRATLLGAYLTVTDALL